MFDDSRLEDRDALAVDERLRRLASAGARVRIEAERAAEPLTRLDLGQPRAIIAAGAEARLVRAMLEPTCPVPFVAWPAAGLPGWVGTLDVVVVIAPDGGNPDLLLTVREAVRRGCSLIVAGPEGSLVAEQAASRSTLLIPTATDDPLAASTLVLAALASARLGPPVDPDEVAGALDRVAEDCSPFVSLASNPAKEIALVLADADILVWGGTVLAARASRRVAEAIRSASGRTALAADAAALAPVLAATPVRSVFDDPFDNPADGRRSALVVLDDGSVAEPILAARRHLERLADERDVRVAPVVKAEGGDLARYAALLQTGTFAAAYLGIGLEGESR